MQNIKPKDISKLPENTKVVLLSAEGLRFKVLSVEMTGRYLTAHEEWIVVHTPQREIVTTSANQDFYVV